MEKLRCRTVNTVTLILSKSNSGSFFFFPYTIYVTLFTGLVRLVKYKRMRLTGRTSTPGTVFIPPQDYIKRTEDC